MAELKLLVLMGDQHCGSQVGLLPPEYVNLDGNIIKQNPIQEWLWSCWKDATESWLPSIVGEDKWALVNMGDATEGIHHRSTEVVCAAESDHMDIAETVLKPIAEKATRVFMVRGTECHTGAAIEQNMGKTFNAEVNPITGRRAFDRLLLDVHGCRCVFRHHIGTTGRPYLEASALSIHLGVEQIEAAKVNHPIPQVLCCAHRHRFGMFRDGHGLCLVTPPWQALTRYGHKVVSAAVTKPGMVVLDWRNRKPGELPDVHERVYAPDPPRSIAI